MAFDEEVQDNSRELAARAEKIKNKLENANPEINAQVFVYPPSEAKRPERKLKSKERFAIPKTRIVDQFPEAREEAEEVYEQIMDQGAVICYSKVLGDEGEAFSDYEMPYVGGEAKAIKKMGNFFHRIGLRRYKSPLLINGTLQEEVTGHSSAIFSHLQSSEEATSTLEKDGVDMMERIADRDPNGEVMVMEHIYHSKSYSRGHLIPVDMMYIMPGEIGKEWEQRTFEHPWLMEALSEVVVEKAGEELEAQNPNDFDFRSLYEGDMSKTRMHEPSGAKEIAMAVSFYNK